MSKVGHFFLLSAEALSLCVRHLQFPQTPAFCCWCLQRRCLRCTGTDTWQDVLSSGSRPRCHYNTLAGGDMPSCLVKHAFYRPGSLGVSSYLPAAPDHWLNLRSCVAVSSGLSQQDQKQASLSYPVLVCVCVHVFLTALLAACVEPTTPSWTAAGGGRKSRAAGRTRGGRRAESAVNWDAPSGSGRPWLPSSTFFRTPHLLNWMLRFGQSYHSGAHCRERGRPETSVSPRGEIYRRQQGGGAAVKNRMDLGSISFPGRPGLSLFQERAWGEGEGMTSWLCWFSSIIPFSRSTCFIVHMKSLNQHRPV